MPSVSPIKHLTKEVKPLCAPVQSVRVSFTWGKHLPLFMKGCCEQAVPENVALTKHKNGAGRVAGVTAKANPAMAPFVSADFSPSPTPHSQCRSDSLKQLLDFQKCSTLLSPTERRKRLLWIHRTRTDAFQSVGY